MLLTVLSANGAERIVDKELLSKIVGLRITKVEFNKDELTRVIEALMSPINTNLRSWLTRSLLIHMRDKRF